jgi:hypothetical protein
MKMYIVHNLLNEDVSILNAVSFSYGVKKLKYIEVVNFVIFYLLMLFKCYKIVLLLINQNHFYEKDVFISSIICDAIFLSK